MCLSSSVKVSAEVLRNKWAVGYTPLVPARVQFPHWA